MNNKTKFKETEIGTVPEEWVFESLEKHADIIMGQSPESAFYNNDGNGLSFLQGIRTFGGKNPTYDTYTTKITKLAKQGSVLLSVRAPVGEVNIANRDICIGRGLMAINSDNNEFIYQLFKAFKSYVVGRETGTVYGSVTKNDIAKLKFPFPPKQEQKQISEILSSLDDKIELNRQINANLEKIASSLFKNWFVDFEFPNEEGKPYKSSGGKMIDSELGDIPEGWRVVEIGEELQTFLGGTPSREEDTYWINGIVPWINSGMVNEYRITKASEYITKEAVENSATKLLSKGTVVIAITGATLGQYSLLEIDSCFNQSVIGIKENRDLKKEFIYYWIATTINKLINSQTGGAQQHINKQVVDSHKILIPNQITLDKYYEVATPIFELISQNCFEVENLSKIRDSLLSRLMSGKIRV